jgi:hypothetical protein
MQRTSDAFAKVGRYFCGNSVQRQECLRNPRIDELASILASTLASR